MIMKQYNVKLDKYTQLLLLIETKKFYDIFNKKRWIPAVVTIHLLLLFH